MLGGDKIVDGLSGDDIMQLSSAIEWVEGQPHVPWLQEAQQRYSFFSYNIFLFSNQMPETLRFDFPLAPVITSLEHDSSTAV